MLKSRRYTVVKWSFLPEDISIKVSADVPTKWYRIGLYPGSGTFKKKETIKSFCSVLVIRPGETRTYEVQWG
ncbi:MAG: hypothetical protein AAGI08_06700 [Bacteroidota bacterium]